jgi:hypothetical protein
VLTHNAQVFRSAQFAKGMFLLSSFFSFLVSLFLNFLTAALYTFSLPLFLSQFVLSDVMAVSMDLGSVVRGTKVMVMDTEGRITDTTNALTVR